MEPETVTRTTAACVSRQGHGPLHRPEKALTPWAILMAELGREQSRPGALIRVGANNVALPRLTLAEAEALREKLTLVIEQAHLQAQTRGAAA